MKKVLLAVVVALMAGTLSSFASHATHVIVNDNVMLSEAFPYYKNGDTPDLRTGTPTNYNAYLNCEMGILVLNGYEGGQISTFYYNDSIQVSVLGNSTITTNRQFGIFFSTPENFGGPKYSAINFYGGASLTINVNNEVDDFDYLDYFDKTKVAGIFTYNNLYIDNKNTSKASLIINAGATDNYHHIYGIYCYNNGKLDFRGNTDLSVNLKNGFNGGQVGLRAYGYEFDCTGDILINTGEGVNYSYGIDNGSTGKPSPMKVYDFNKFMIKIKRLSNLDGAGVISTCYFNDIDYAFDGYCFYDKATVGDPVHTVTYTKKEANRIREVSLSLDEPAVGKTPSTDVKANGEGYTVEEVRWWIDNVQIMEPENYTFKEGVVYTLQVVLKPKVEDAYVWFGNKNGINVIINGKAGVVSRYETPKKDLVVSVDFFNQEELKLWLGHTIVTNFNMDDIPITSGTARYTSGNVLYLTDATIKGSPGITSEINDLTIVIRGNCSIDGLALAGAYIMDGTDDATLTINKGIYSSGNLTIANKNVIINSGDEVMFEGDGETTAIEFGCNTSVFGMNNTQIVKGVTSLVINEPSGFVLGGLGIFDDSQITFDATKQTILNGSSPLTNYLMIGQYYPIWFNNNQITKPFANYLNFMFNQEIMNLYYDEEDVVMRLGEAFNAIAFGRNQFRSEAPNLRIELGGDWSVASTDADVPAMTLKGNTTFTGNGKLTVESDGVGISLGKGVTVDDFPSKADLTIDGIDMEVTAAKQGICGSERIINGVSLYDNTLTFKNSNATITSSGSNAEGYCLYRLKNLVLDGCKITNDVKFTGSMIPYPKVVIGKTTYDLNNDGKVTAADIQVIINEMKKPQAEQDMKYDLNGDNKVTAADIQIIINEMKK